MRGEGHGAAFPQGRVVLCRKKSERGGKEKRPRLEVAGPQGQAQDLLGQKKGGGGVRVNVVSKPRELCADHINHFGFWRERL